MLNTRDGQQGCLGAELMTTSHSIPRVAYQTKWRITDSEKNSWILEQCSTASRLNIASGHDETYWQCNMQDCISPSFIYPVNRVVFIVQLIKCFHQLAESLEQFRWLQKILQLNDIAKNGYAKPSCSAIWSAKCNHSASAMEIFDMSSKEQITNGHDIEIRVLVWVLFLEINYQSRS